MSATLPSPASTDESEDAASPRRGLDGAGWFVMILTVALLYGLTISALSGTDTRADTDVAPRPATAMVVHGDGPGTSGP